MTEALLALSGYGVAFGRKPVLRDIHLAIPDRGMTVLLGPSGTGKSTLLRTLAGVNDANPSLQVKGSALFRGEPLGVLGTPAIVMQKTRLMMATLRENIVNELPERHTLQLYQQRDIAARLLSAAGLEYLADNLDRCVIDLTLGEQRLVALIRTVAANPTMIFVDEPTSGISDEDAARILLFLSREAEKRAVVTVLHHQRQARLLGGTSVLLAGGTLVETALTADFFAHPVSTLAKDYVRTGSCSAPSPSTPEEEEEETHDKPDCRNQSMSAESVADFSAPASEKSPRIIKSHAFGPRNFLWLKKGQLAGTPRPGLTQDLDLDLAALQRVGVSVLVSLESEVAPIAPESLAQHGILGTWLPIKDMGIPSLQDAQDLCQTMAQWLRQGEAIALHCKAGIGRTGTMLVTYLIYDGMRALDALEYARRIEPRWVQSREQVDFLESFEQFLAEISGEGEPVTMSTLEVEGNITTQYTENRS